jgi:hypothetical protein
MTILPKEEVRHQETMEDDRIEKEEPLPALLLDITNITLRRPPPPESILGIMKEDPPRRIPVAGRHPKKRDDHPREVETVDTRPLEEEEARITMDIVKAIPIGDGAVEASILLLHMTTLWNTIDATRNIHLDRAPMTNNHA